MFITYWDSIPNLRGLTRRQQGIFSENPRICRDKAINCLDLATHRHVAATDAIDGLGATERPPIRRIWDSQLQVLHSQSRQTLCPMQSFIYTPNPPLPAPLVFEISHRRRNVAIPPGKPSACARKTIAEETPSERSLVRGPSGTRNRGWLPARMIGPEAEGVSGAKSVAVLAPGG